MYLTWFFHFLALNYPHGKLAFIFYFCSSSLSFIFPRNFQFSRSHFATTKSEKGKITKNKIWLATRERVSEWGGKEFFFANITHVVHVWWNIEHIKFHGVYSSFIFFFVRLCTYIHHVIYMKSCTCSDVQLLARISVRWRVLFLGTFIKNYFLTSSFGFSYHLPI